MTDLFQRTILSAQTAALKISQELSPKDVQQLIADNMKEISSLYPQTIGEMANLPNYDEFEQTVLFKLRGLYKKFEEGDCDPNIEEMDKLQHALVAIEAAVLEVERIYNEH